MGGQKSRIVQFVRVILFILAVMLFCIFSVLSLMAVDKHYTWFRGALVRFIKADNHFDGDLWFSAVATLIGGLLSAVPGLMCGLLAYIQTERLHELEDRYHRPGLELDEAKVSVIVLRDKEGDLRKSTKNVLDRLSQMPYPYRYRMTLEKAIDRQFPFYIVLKTKFHVKNEVTVKRISVRQADFLIGEKVLKWMLNEKKKNSDEGCHKIWEFDKEINPGEAKYTLEWILMPFERKETTDSWEAMRDFVFYKEMFNSECRYLRLNVHLDVEYEYSARNGTECMLCVDFDGDKMQQDSVLPENSSCNGYFTYDLKRERSRFPARK